MLFITDIGVIIFWTTVDERKKIQSREDKKSGKRRIQELRRKKSHPGYTKTERRVMKKECEICGTTSFLTLHHVNGIQKDRKTVQVVCKSCHDAFNRKKFILTGNRHGRITPEFLVR